MNSYLSAIHAISRIEEREKLIWDTPWYVRLWCALRGHSAREELMASFMCERCGHREWKD